MKTFTKFLTMLAVAALFATGCVNEEPPYKEDPNPEPAGTTGYLSIGNLSMTVVYDETEIRPDDTSDETQAARTASGTRATAPDGKYNIVVSCSTSAYGDYMDACTTNVMYVDDFEWVY